MFQGNVVTTGIFKSPVEGTVHVKRLNLEGDRQADLSVHGGPDKAVYAYSLDAYPWWEKSRPQDKFPFGAFGENLSIDELSEDQIFIGDTFEVGETVLQAAQPRFPCYKLGVKFNDMSILKTFMKSGRPGVYFRVLREGGIHSGQKLKLVSREKILLSVVELFSLDRRKIKPTQAAEYLKIKSLPPDFRAFFQSIVDGE